MQISGELVASISVSIVMWVIGGIAFYFCAIADIRERVKAVEIKSELFWKIVEKDIGHILKSPTHYSKDLLITKMQSNKITIDELLQLKTQLIEEFKSGTEKATLYILMLARIEQLLWDKQHQRTCKRPCLFVRWLHKGETA